jgi:hypothetical protein
MPLPRINFPKLTLSQGPISRINIFMETSRSFVPVAAVSILLMLLAFGYVGTYVVLVHPDPDPFAFSLGSPNTLDSPNYLLGGDWAQRIYWPLEQLDRRLRPEVWWMC